MSDERPETCIVCKAPFVWCQCEEKCFRCGSDVRAGSVYVNGCEDLYCGVVQRERQPHD